MANEIVLYNPNEEGAAIYRTDDNTLQLDVQVANETVWLTQNQIAILFGTQRPAITKHLNNIYNSGELDFESICSILERMGNDGKQRYQTKYYNLDAILSVGYRHIWKKRTQQLIDAVASGRLLILSPWMHEPNKRTITRAECVALNQMAEEISASH